MKMLYLLAVLLISACATKEYDPLDYYVDPGTGLRWLEDADPIKDFEISVYRSDFRFLGVYGEGLDLPGIPRHCLGSREDVRIIDWTTDEIFSEEHLRLKGVAEDYASRFNERMLEYLKENRNYKCET